MSDREAVPVANILRRLAEINSQMRSLEIEKAALEGLMTRGTIVVSGTSTATLPTMTATGRMIGSAGDARIIPPSSGMTTSVTLGPSLEFRPYTVGPAGPTDAIMTLVRSQPNLKPGDVVKQLVGKIATTAKNPEKMLYQTIANLEKRGRLNKDNTGRLTATEP